MMRRILFLATLAALSGCATSSPHKTVSVPEIVSHYSLQSVVAPVGSITLVPKDVELVWLPSQDTETETVTSYRLYYDTETRFDNDGTWESNYLNVVDVGLVTNFNLQALRGNTTYYFAATAVDQNGVESDLSEEAVYTTPFVMDLEFAFNQPVTNVVLQASTDLIQWQDFGVIPVNGVWRVTGHPETPVLFFRGKASTIP